MDAIAPWRLNVLRLAYLLLTAGLGPIVWPAILQHHSPWPLAVGVKLSFLGALSLLAVLGLRHPLKMLPLLFFEMTWKVIWLAAVAWPAWSSGPMDPATAETAAECLGVVVFLVLIPWRYVYGAYVKAPGEPWRRLRR